MKKITRTGEDLTTNDEFIMKKSFDLTGIRT
jgi:hypothetical protein